MNYTPEGIQQACNEYTDQQYHLSQERDAAYAEGRRDEAKAHEWQPIETAPDEELVVVFYLQKEGDEEVDMHTLDFKEDGCWVHHNDHYEHYCAVAKGGDVGWIGPSEKAPYTHWKKLGTPAGTTAGGSASGGEGA